ncbi:MAG TPA: CcmD family protein, partial [Candidatus Acidoferrales bacterium]
TGITRCAARRGRGGGGEAVKNFESLMAAYMVAWAIFFGYQWTVGRRLAQVREEVERLKKAVTSNQ